MSSLRIAVVGLNREELKKAFNARQCSNRDTFTDGVNTYIYVDEFKFINGMCFDKIYDFRLLRNGLTDDLTTRMSNYLEGYYIGKEKYKLKLVLEHQE